MQALENPPTRPLISVISAAFNEEAGLTDFYIELAKALDGQDFDAELIWIDDGSRDRTFQIMKEQADRDPRIRIFRMERNFGSMAAYNCGLRNMSGDAAVLLSTDLQDPPSLIPKFVASLRAGNAVTWAVRERREDPFMKFVLARGFYLILRLFVFPGFPVDGADTGLFARAVVDEYLALPGGNRNPIFSIYAMGYPSAKIPYVRQARRKGTSGWPFRRRLNAAIDILFTFSDLPIRLACAVALATLSVLALAAVTFLATDGAWPGVDLALGLALLTLTTALFIG